MSRIFGFSHPKQLFCLHYCNTYEGGSKEGWEFYKEVEGWTTWRCHECGKERYGINGASYFRNMPTDPDEQLEYLKSQGRRIK